MTSVLRAPTSFFDTTPLGRILNRFSRDVDVIDAQLGSSMAQVLNTLFNVIGAVIAICIATNGAFLIPLIPIGFLYMTIRRYFRRSSTALQRLESVTRSPIFSSFSECVQGSAVIRAYGHTRRFVDQNIEFIDHNNAPFLLVSYAGQWLGLRLD